MTEPAHPQPAQAAVASTAPVADRTAELSEMLGYLAACWDEERRLLARQLHDSLGSSMTALTMHLALLSSHLKEQPQRDRAAQMKQLLNNVIETNRKMQFTVDKATKRSYIELDELVRRGGMSFKSHY